MAERKSTVGSALAAIGGFALFFLVFGLTLDPSWPENVLAARFAAMATVWIGAAAILATIVLWVAARPELRWARTFAWFLLAVGVAALGAVVVTRVVDGV